MAAIAAHLAALQHAVPTSCERCGCLLPRRRCCHPAVAALRCAPELEC